MSEVSTRATLEIVAVDKAAAALDTTSARIKKIQGELKQMKDGGAGGGQDNIMTRGMQIFTGMVFLRYAQRAAQAINAYIDAPLKNAMETATKMAESLYSRETENRMQAVSRALREQKYELQSIRFTRSQINEKENSDLELMELKERNRNKSTGVERDYLEMQQAQRAQRIGNQNAMKGEIELLQKQIAQEAALSTMIEARQRGGNMQEALEARKREARQALDSFLRGTRGAAGRPDWLIDTLAAASAMGVKGDTTKMLMSYIEALNKVGDAEEKNVKTLQDEREATKRSIEQARERISTLKLLAENIQSMTIEERSQFVRGEYEKYLEKRKSYYEKLTEAIRNARTESEAFVGGSMAYIRWMREPAAPMGQTPYARGYNSSMTPALAQDRGRFEGKILDDLSRAVRIWESIETFIKGRATDTDTMTGAGSF